MGLFDSTSTKSGGQVGSSDTLSNNNAYASAPVFNINDERKGSGKYVAQAANNYNLSVSNTDYGAIGDALEFAGDVFSDSLYATSQAQSEFLGEVGNFADTAAAMSEYQAQLSSDQAKEAFYFAESMAAKNSSLAESFSQNIASAYDTANDSMLVYAQSSQDATTTALDYVFESSKSETERVSDGLIKWGAIVGVVAIVAPVVLRAIK